MDLAWAWRCTGQRGIEGRRSAARELVLSPGQCQGPVVRERLLCLRGGGKRQKEQGVGSRVAGNDVSELVGMRSL